MSELTIKGPRESWGRLTRIAALFMDDHPRKKRGAGIARCVIYTNGSGPSAYAYWTKAGRVVVGIETKSGTVTAVDPPE